MKFVALIILALATSVASANLKADLMSLKLQDGSCISDKAQISKLFEKALDTKNIFEDDKGNVVVWTTLTDNKRSAVAFTEEASTKVLTTNLVDGDGNATIGLATEICLPVGFSAGTTKHLEAKVSSFVGDYVITITPKDVNSIELAGDGATGVFTRMDTRRYDEDPNLRLQLLTQMEINPTTNPAATK